ncbi:MAG: hypothetical protein U0163_18125 [Gemmatimonadaceae bacterium]
MNRIVNETFIDGGKHTDPVSHDVPTALILSKEYAAMRLLLRMTPPRTPGQVPPPGSNHVTVIDGKGNVATVLPGDVAPGRTDFAMGVSIAASRALPAHHAVTGRSRDCVRRPDHHPEEAKPVLAAGSPSVGLLQNILQNTVNILDFGVSIEESVVGALGGPSAVLPGANYVEWIWTKGCGRGRRNRGAVVRHDPWHFMNGSYEGIHVDASGVASACADPRRSGLSEAV